MEKEREEEEEEKPTLKVERAGGPLTSAHLDGERAEDGYFFVFLCSFLAAMAVGILYVERGRGRKKYADSTVLFHALRTYMRGRVSWM